MATISPQVWKSISGERKCHLTFARDKRLKQRTTKKLERQADIMALYLELLPQYPDPECLGLSKQIASILGIDARRVYDDMKEIFQGISKGDVNRAGEERRRKLLEEFDD